MPTDDKDIRDAQQRFWQAGNAGDAAALETLLDDEFVYVEADSLERKDKTAFIAQLADRSDELEVKSFELTAVHVQHSGDMAVAFAQFHIEHEDDGETYQSSGNAVEVLVRRTSGWKVTGSVFGEVPPFVE